MIRDCLRDLRAHLADIKFLGSYPVGGIDGEVLREEVTAARHAADAWIEGLEEHLD